MRHLARLPLLIADLMQTRPGSPERGAVIEEFVTMAMKADTYELLDERGYVPEALRHLAKEGEPVGKE